MRLKNGGEMLVLKVMGGGCFLKNLETLGLGGENVSFQSLKTLGKVKC